MKISTDYYSGFRSGILLIECLIYIALFSIVLTFAFTAFFRGLTSSRQLQKNASDIGKILQAGERWRDDVRHAQRPPAWIETADGPAFEIPQQSNTVVYVFTDESVYRLQNTNALWIKLLSRVKSSSMEKEIRNQTVAWHWHVELSSNQQSVRVRPLFTFSAVQLEKP